MNIRRTVLAAAGFGLVIALPAVATAQECKGENPKGGRFVTSADLYFDRARRNPANARDLYEQAVAVLQEGTQKQVDNPKNWALLGEAYAELGRYEDANDAFSRAEEMWSCYEAEIDTLRYKAWVPAFNRAVGYIQRGDNEKALESYLDAWTVYKKLPQPQLQIGGIYANMALTAESEEARKEAGDKAVAAYRLALETLAEKPERLNEQQQQDYSRAAAFNLAQLLAFQGRFEEAVDAYEMFLAQDPGNIDAMSNVAVVMVRASQQYAAEAQDMEEGPEKEALLAKADSLREGANAYYTDLLDREDLSAEEYHNVGLGLLRISFYERAARAFAKALDLEPYRINSLEQLARAEFAAERYDTLAVVAKTLTDRYPLNLDDLALLANAYRELGHSDEALAVLERREALEVQITDLELEGEEGVFTVSGYLENLKAEPNTELALQFDFYDDAGEVVATETATLVIPEQQAQAEFSVSTESTALISGVTYHVPEAAEAQSGG